MVFKYIFSCSSKCIRAVLFLRNTLTSVQSMFLWRLFKSQPILTTTHSTTDHLLADELTSKRATTLFGSAPSEFEFGSRFLVRHTEHIRLLPPTNIRLTKPCWEILQCNLLHITYSKTYVFSAPQTHVRTGPRGIWKNPFQSNSRGKRSHHPLPSHTFQQAIQTRVVALDGTLSIGITRACVAYMDVGISWWWGRLCVVSICSTSVMANRQPADTNCN